MSKQAKSVDLPVDFKCLFLCRCRRLQATAPLEAPNGQDFSHSTVERRVCSSRPARRQVGLQASRQAVRQVDRQASTPAGRFLEALRQAVTGSSWEAPREAS